jgi:hypothetical protein
MARSDVFQEFSIAAISASTQTYNDATSPLDKYEIAVSQGSLFPGSFALSTGYVYIPPTSTLPPTLQFTTNILYGSALDASSALSTGEYGFELCLTNGGFNASAHFSVVTNIVILSSVIFTNPPQYPVVTDGFWTNGSLRVHQTCRIQIQQWSNPPPSQQCYVRLSMSTAGDSLSLGHVGSSSTSFTFPVPTGSGNYITLRSNAIYTATLEFHYIVASTNFTVSPDPPVIFFPRDYDVGVEHVARTHFMVHVVPDPVLEVTAFEDYLSFSATNFIVSKTYQLASATNLLSEWQSLMQTIATNNSKLLTNIYNNSDILKFFRLQWD